MSHTPRTKTNPAELDEGVYRDRRHRMITAAPDSWCRKYLDVMILVTGGIVYKQVNQHLTKDIISSYNASVHFWSQ